MVIASELLLDTLRLLGIIYDALYLNSHNHSPH